MPSGEDSFSCAVRSGRSCDVARFEENSRCAYVFSDAMEALLDAPLLLSDVPPLHLDAVSSWVLFHRERLRLPSMDVAVPEIVYQEVIYHDAVRKLASLPYIEELSKPSFSLTECVGRGWRTGSSWMMRDVGKALAEDNFEFIPLEYSPRSRFAVYETDGKAALFITSQMSDGMLAFYKSKEIDGATTEDTFGMMERSTGVAIASYTKVARKSCPFCIARDRACDCAPSLTQKYFERDLMARQQQYRESKSLMGAARNQYARSCFSGRWVYHADGEPAVSITVNIHLSGAVMKNSLVHVLQSEMDSLLQPSYGLITSEDAYVPPPAPIESQKPRRALPATPSPTPFEGEKVRESGYSCPLCNAPIKRQYDIARHIRCVHQKVRSHQCFFCLRSFQQRGHLNDHVRITHKLNSGYMCTICGKNFASQSKLTRHVGAVHENQRNYSCSHCGKTYKDKRGLNYHITINHDTDP